VEALANRLGTRFLVVTVVPNVLIIAYVAFLIAAGAPGRSPSLTRAVMVLSRLTAIQIVAVFLGLLILSIATHPLQTPLIQFVEGYWWSLPLGPAIMDRCTERFREEWDWAQNEVARIQEIQKRGWAEDHSLIEVEHRLYWLPKQPVKLLPTCLGNTLQTGEIRAGERYGLALDAALPRLAPLLSPVAAAELSDRRNQLDAAVRLCVMAGLATVVSVGLLLWHGPWLFLALGTYLLCWACYQAAVAAAKGFSNSLAAAIDTHHLRLFDAMELKRPADLTEELYRNVTLDRMFRGETLDDEEQEDWRYVLPGVDGPGPEQGSAPTLQ
jgi:hypothetical protein